jgi:hypothetical protein
MPRNLFNSSAPGWKEGLGVILLVLVVVLLPSVHWEVLFSQHDNRESILKKYRAILAQIRGHCRRWTSEERRWVRCPAMEEEKQGFLIVGVASMLCLLLNKLQVHM